MLSLEYGNFEVSIRQPSEAIERIIEYTDWNSGKRSELEIHTLYSISEVTKDVNIYREETPASSTLRDS